MFDIGFWEMAFIGVIALVVIGPERLPGVARTAGLWVGKARRMVADIKADVKKEMNEYDLQQVQELKDEISTASNELKDISEKASDSMGIREAGEQIKNSVTDVSDSLDLDGDLAGGKTTADTPKKKAKKSTSKKKASGKPQQKKTAKKKSTTKKSTRKKAAKKKAVSSKSTAKKKATGSKAAATKLTRKSGATGEGKPSTMTGAENDDG